VLFAAALEKAAEAEREAFLDVACAGDPGLWERLAGLLRGHEQSLGILDRTSPAPGPADVVALPATGEVGRPAPRIGGTTGDLIAGR
jgi:hypothetical protein